MRRVFVVVVVRGVIMFGEAIAGEALEGDVGFAPYAPSEFRIKC